MLNPKPSPKPRPGVTSSNTTDAPLTTILQNLEAGRINFDQASHQLKTLQEKEG